MHPTPNTRRFVFQTQGVCPPEIHFTLVDGTLQEVRFVGGGCPGNALLVSRLLSGRPVDARSDAHVAAGTAIQST